VRDGSAIDIIDPPLVLGKFRIETDNNSSLFLIVADSSFETPKRTPESQGVIRSDYFIEGFTSELASKDIAGFLFDTMSCMKSHWRRYHARPSMRAVVRRVRMSLPMKIPDDIEGRFKPLKRDGQEWSFRVCGGEYMKLSIVAFPIHSGGPPGSL